MKKIIALLVCCFQVLIAPSLFAAAIQEIIVQGNKHVPKETVFNYLPVREGDTFDEKTSHDIIQALYNTGFFKQVRVDFDKEHRLNIHCVEEPVIGQITFHGNRSLGTEELRKALREVGLYEGAIVQPKLLHRVQADIEAQYLEMGRYQSKVSIEQRPIHAITQGRVELYFVVDEGIAAHIKDIRILGATHFPEKLLLKQMQLQATNLASKINKRDRYSKQRLIADLEKLNAFYLDRGFLNMQVLGTEVALSENLHDLYIYIRLSEGLPYTFAEITTRGFVPDAVILPELISCQQGNTFSRKEVTDSIMRITEELGKHGYADAEVKPIPHIDDNKKQVQLLFDIEAGKRFHVRRISFKGNEKTLDQVLRRQLEQSEYAIYSSEQIEKSKSKLNRSGYFKNVTVAMQPVSGVDDALDLEIVVDEAPIGSVEGGFGYSDAEGFLFNFNLSNQNFLGTGNSLDLRLEDTQTTTRYNMGFHQPYYRLDGRSRGFNLFYNKTNLSKTSQVSSYSTGNVGANMNFGFPIADNISWQVGLGLEQTNLEVTDSAPTEIQSFVTENGTVYNQILLSSNIQINQLNRSFFPTDGSQHNLNVVAALWGSDLEYYRIRANSKAYYPTFFNSVAAYRFQVGYGDGYGGSNHLPFFQHFFAGGTRSVRGFNESALGPRDSNANPFGGNFMVAGSLVWIAPSFQEIGRQSYRISFFADAGQVYDLDRKLEGENGLRYSVGLSLSWLSPMGPLEFIFAKPVHRYPNDKVQGFAFNIGSVF